MNLRGLHLHLAFFEGYGVIDKNNNQVRLFTL